MFSQQDSLVDFRAGRRPHAQYVRAEARGARLRAQGAQAERVHKDEQAPHDRQGAAGARLDDGFRLHLDRQDGGCVRGDVGSVCRLVG